MVMTVQISTAELWTTALYLIQIALMVACAYGLSQRLAGWQLGGEKRAAEIEEEGAPRLETGPSRLALEQMIGEKMAKIAGPKEESKRPSSDPLRCDVCNGLTLNGPKQFRDHLSTQKHKDRVRQHQLNAEEAARRQGLAEQKLNEQVKRVPASTQTGRAWLANMKAPGVVVAAVQQAETPDELLEAVLQWYLCVLHRS